MNLIFHQLGCIVAQIPNATLADALGQSMLIGCSNAAEMYSLPTKNKHVTSLSIVPASRFLVKNMVLIASPSTFSSSMELETQ